MLAVFAALLAGAALAQEPGERQPMPPAVDTQAPRSSGGNLFYGGYVGLSFGSVNYVELSPMVGYRFSPSSGPASVSSIATARTTATNRALP